MDQSIQDGHGQVSRPQAEINLTGRVFLLLSAILAALATIGLMPVLPAIEASFSDTPNAATLTRSLISSLSVAMIFGSFMAGHLGGKFGLRTVLLIGLVVYAMAGAAGFVLNSLGLLLVSRIVLGFSTSVIQTLMMALVAVSFAAAQRDRWMGWIAAAGTVGSLVIVPLAGLVGNIGWRYVFLLYLFALPLVLIAAAGIKSAHPPRSSQAAAETAPAERLSMRIWLSFGLAVGTGAMVNAVPMFLPFYLASIGELLPSRIATAMLCTTLAGALVALLYGTVRRWLSLTQVFAVGFLVGGLGMLLVSQSDSYIVVLLALILNGLGIGLTIPNLGALAATISSPAQSGKVIGMTMGCFFLGAPFSQAVLEVLTSGKPAHLPMLILACIALALSGIWFLLQTVFKE